MKAEDLHRMRQLAALSRQELAEKMGWTGPNAHQRIYDYESERRKMSVGTSTAIRLLLAPLQPYQPSAETMAALGFKFANFSPHQSGWYREHLDGAAPFADAAQHIVLLHLDGRTSFQKWRGNGNIVRYESERLQSEAEFLGKAARYFAHQPTI